MNKENQIEATRGLRRFLFFERVFVAGLLLVAFFVGRWELMQQRSRLSDLKAKGELVESKIEQGLIPRNQVNGQGEFVELLDRTPAERSWGIFELAEEISGSLRSSKLEEVLPRPIPENQLALLLISREQPHVVGLYNGGISARVVIELGVPVKPIPFKLERREAPELNDDDQLPQNQDESFEWTKVEIDFPKNQWSRFRLNGPERVFEFNAEVMEALDFDGTLLQDWNRSKSEVGWSSISLQGGPLPNGLSFQTDLEAMQKQGMARIYDFQLFDSDDHKTDNSGRHLIGWLRVSLKLDDR